MDRDAFTSFLSKPVRRLDADRGRRARVSEADAKLWREATRDVKPIRETPAEAAPPLPFAPVSPEPPPALAASAAPKALVRALPPVQIPVQPAAVPAGGSSVAGLDRGSAARLRRGTLPVEARLDLHGLTQEQAHHALNGFLARQFAAERRVVLVITGRGFSTRGQASAEGTGILRRSLPRWLHEGVNRERVLAWSPAQPRDGGSGAFYVLLRRRRDPP